MSHLQMTGKLPVFRNWSGSFRFTPGQILKPRDEEELASIVHTANATGQGVRTCGYGHSSVPLVQTPHLLVSLEHVRGLVTCDPEERTATVRAGTPLRDVGLALHQVSLALHNYGDVATQFIAGAFGTGTHGTGRSLQDLSSALMGVRLVTADGSVVEWNERDHPAELQAARVSLGSLGIFTELKLRVLPTYALHRQEYCTTVDACLTHLDELVERNRNFDFYWYPRRDEVKLRLLNEPGCGPPPLPYARLLTEEVGASWQVLPRHRELKFDEMEYALPLEAGPACFQEVRSRIKQRHRRDVGWRVLYRTIKADDTWLSNAYQRDTVTISLHHNAGLPYWSYFRDIEPIFLAYDGRPHWGKKHTLGGATLSRMYPRWEAFHTLRRRLDPRGVFLNAYLRALFGDTVESALDEVETHEVPAGVPTDGVIGREGEAL